MGSWQPDELKRALSKSGAPHPWTFQFWWTWEPTGPDSPVCNLHDGKPETRCYGFSVKSAQIPVLLPMFSCLQYCYPGYETVRLLLQAREDIVESVPDGTAHMAGQAVELPTDTVDLLLADMCQATDGQCQQPARHSLNVFVPASYSLRAQCSRWSWSTSHCAQPNVYLISQF